MKLRRGFGNAKIASPAKFEPALQCSKGLLNQKPIFGNGLIKGFLNLGERGVSDRFVENLVFNPSQFEVLVIGPTGVSFIG